MGSPAAGQRIDHQGKREVRAEGKQGKDHSLAGSPETLRQAAGPEPGREKGSYRETGSFKASASFRLEKL